MRQSGRHHGVRRYAEIFIPSVRSGSASWGTSRHPAYSRLLLVNGNSVVVVRRRFKVHLGLRPLRRSSRLLDASLPVVRQFATPKSIGNVPTNYHHTLTHATYTLMSPIGERWFCCNGATISKFFFLSFFSMESMFLSPIFYFPLQKKLQLYNKIEMQTCVQIAIQLFLSREKEPVCQ